MWSGSKFHNSPSISLIASVKQAIAVKISFSMHFDWSGLTFDSLKNSTGLPWRSRSFNMQTGLEIVPRLIKICKQNWKACLHDVEDCLDTGPKNVGFQMKMFMPVHPLTKNQMPLNRLLCHRQAVLLESQVLQQPFRVESGFLYPRVLHRPIAHRFERISADLFCFAEFFFQHLDEFIVKVAFVVVDRSNTLRLILKAKSKVLVNFREIKCCRVVEAFKVEWTSKKMSKPSSWKRVCLLRMLQGFSDLWPWIFSMGNKNFDNLSMSAYRNFLFLQKFSFQI